MPDDLQSVEIIHDLAEEEKIYQMRKLHVKPVLDQFEKWLEEAPYATCRRRNWLFAGSPSGAKASGTFFTLTETAKANGFEQYRNYGSSKMQLLMI